MNIEFTQVMQLPDCGETDPHTDQKEPFAIIVLCFLLAFTEVVSMLQIF